MTRFLLAFLVWVSLAAPVWGAELAGRQSIILAPGADRVRTAPVAVDPLTDTIEVRLRRPTTLAPLAWDASGTLRVTLVLVVDGTEYPASFLVSGGIRLRPDGTEIAETVLRSHPTVQYRPGTKATVQIDGRTYQRGTRISEGAASVSAYVLIERLRGVVTTDLTASTSESEAPLKLVKNSVAYDADTSSSEVAGDGVITLSHTPAGSSGLAAFANVSQVGTQVGTATYDGSAMTELWDASAGTASKWHAGYQLAPVPTGASNVVSTLAAGPTEHIFGVITFTGVSDAAPVGATFTATGTTGQPTVTVTDATVDDLIVAGLAWFDDDFESTLGAAGAGQTEQWRVNTGTANDNSFGVGATQPGDSDGVMSWANGTQTSWGLGAVAMKAPTFSLEQEGFAFGDDDGNEAAHTLDTQDTNVTEDLGTKTLRVLVNSTDDPTSLAYTLRSQKNGSGGYTAVPLAATSDSTPTPTTDEGTESGNNVASLSWAVSYPNASTGDLIIIGISWDDSTDTTDVTEPAGPNGETLSEVNATPAVSSSTEVRAKVWYTIATGTWTASTLTFTPSASEQWTAAVVVIPAGDFDPDTPIGANTTNASAGSETAIVSAAFTAGSTDGGGRVFAWTAADVDPQTLAADWTQIANEDRGAVSGGMFTRDAVVSDSESIAADTVSTIAGDTWCSVSFVVRGTTVTNQVYVSTSANVAASGEATTARLAAPSGKTTGDFTTGRRWDDENGTDSIDIVADQYTEVEWVLTTQSPAAANDYFEFRVYKGAAAVDTYTVTPKWTIPGGAGCVGGFKTLLGAGPC